MPYYLASLKCKSTFYPKNILNIAFEFPSPFFLILSKYTTLAMVKKNFFHPAGSLTRDLEFSSVVHSHLKL